MLEVLERAVAAGELPAGAPLTDVVEYKDLCRMTYAINCIHAGLAKKARAHLRAAATTERYRRARQYWYARSFVPPLLWGWARGVKRFFDGVVRARPEQRSAATADDAARHAGARSGGAHRPDAQESVS
jgi:hypothetical protein